MVVSLASAGGAAKIYCTNGGGQSNKNAAAWLEAKVGTTKRRRGGQGGTGGEGEIRLIQVFIHLLPFPLELMANLDACHNVGL